MKEELSEIFVIDYTKRLIIFDNQLQEEKIVFQTLGFTFGPKLLET
jgi:hypothetical protein